MRRILWGRATSSNVMKVIWTLEELQLPYERIDVGGSFGKTDTPEYRAMNPTGLVPTLQEDDFTLWESNAICRYLCHAHAPHSKLWPQEPRARANVDHWMDAQQTCSTVRSPRYSGAWSARRPRSATWRRSAGDRGCARRLAHGLGRAGQASRIWRGDDLTLADMPWGPHLHRWFNMDFERPEIPHLRAWYDRLLQRPAYKQHSADPWCRWPFDPEAVRAFEHARWQEAASVYETTFANATKPFIEPLLDAAPSRRVCGCSTSAAAQGSWLPPRVRAAP